MLLQDKNIKIYSYIYLAIPLLLFLGFWLDLPYMFGSICALCYILYKIFSKMQNKQFEVEKKHFFWAIGICLIWCIISGHGGLYYQNIPDWNIKNAVMHDLINYPWPVVYDNNVPLVYYFGIMLPGALLGKFMLQLGIGHDAAFNIANLGLLVWTTMGIFLTLLNLCFLTPKKKYKIFYILLIMVFFSGLDILIQHIQSPDIPFHIEWHFADFQYSSNFTLTSFAYNHTIQTWLIVSLFMSDIWDISKYGILGAFALFCAPMPFIGLLGFFILFTIADIYREPINVFIQKVFDVKNILSLILIVPFIYFYYKSSYVAYSNSIYIINFRPISYILFVSYEALVFGLIIWHKFYKNPLFYITMIILMICPILAIGPSRDLCMRASIPALFVLMTLCINYLFISSENNREKLMKYLLILCLLVGSVTPIWEIYRGIKNVYIIRGPIMPKDYVKTLNNRIAEDNQWVEYVGQYNNYGCIKPEKFIFWKYFAR